VFTVRNVRQEASDGSSESEIYTYAAATQTAY